MEKLSLLSGLVAVVQVLQGFVTNPFISTRDVLHLCIFILIQ